MHTSFALLWKCLTRSARMRQTHWVMITFILLRTRWCSPHHGDGCLDTWRIPKTESLCCTGEGFVLCDRHQGRCVEVKELVEPLQPFSLLATTPPIVQARRCGQRALAGAGAVPDGSSCFGTSLMRCCFLLAALAL